MKKSTVEYDYDLCVACGICTQTCPVECLGLSKSQIGRYKNKLYPQMEDSDACTTCMLCEKECPIDAVKVKVVSDAA